MNYFLLIKSKIFKEYRSRPIFLLFAGLLLTSYSQAQVSTNAAGGTAKSNGGSIAFSLGQVVYTTQTASLGSVAQGVQHTYAVFPVDSGEELSAISVSVFPNPTEDYLTIKVSDFNDQMLWYQLFDLQGRLLHYGLITDSKTNIDMKSLAAAVYYVKVYKAGGRGDRTSTIDGTEDFRIFKIIKK
jgi:hypothetical protein